MPTIKDKIYFNYGDIWSDTFNILNVVLDSGMYEEDLLPVRTITETKPRGADKPIFFRVDEEPREFNMTLAFDGEYTDEDINQIVRWLFPNTYKPLFFQGQEDKVYYCMPIDSSSIVHTGLSQGYVTITMRCDSPYIYSPMVITDVVTVSGTAIIEVENDGHFTIYPEMSILKIGSGHVVIERMDSSQDIFEIRDLTNMEDLYLDCKKEIIETDAVGVYRYDKIVGEFPYLAEGTNEFRITGNCEIQFRYKNRYRF